MVRMYSTLETLYTWLAEKSLRPNTAKGWQSSYRVHIGSYFGHMNLGEIDEHEVLVFRKILEYKGLKASSINDKIMKPLGMCLYTAHRRGHIDRYPCANIKKLKEDIPQIDPLTFEELEHLEQVLEKKGRHMFRDMVRFWSHTGLRVGELCALEWGHIDFFNGKAMVRQTMHSNGLVGPPKTQHSIRDIDLNEEAVRALERQK